jgi:arsenite methyltransferase
MSSDSRTSLNPEQIKACCAAGYSSDLVTMLLGEAYHPGGQRLTRHVLEHLDVSPGRTLIDVASGIGTTSLLAATDYGVAVVGVDLSETNVKLATGAAEKARLGGRVVFHHGDAEALPLPAASADAVICECALCTFPDKDTAVAEMARVLRPGGRIGISDITAERDRLAEELTSLSAWIACVADARPAVEYEALLTTHGLRVRVVEEHREALDRMILQIAARIELLRITARDRAESLGLNFAAVPGVLSAAQDAIETGALGYAVVIAEKPADPLESA